MKLLHEYIHEVLQSHHNEPQIGDTVVNVNPSCKHFKSEGIVVAINELPNDAGKTATYICSNDGPTWARGDILEKTLDQLEQL
tara:strand:+ start:1289 stop:1537 length:249 start_codon:yes stop_codon:yes gene_type:complete